MDLSLDTQHVGHCVETGRAAFCPKRRFDGAAGENSSICGAMGEFDTLAFAGKDHRVLPDNPASAQRCKPDIARTARDRYARRERERMISARSISRPAAAASPSIKAVPDGASTFIR